MLRNGMVSFKCCFKRFDFWLDHFERVFLWDNLRDIIWRTLIWQGIPFEVSCNWPNLVEKGVQKRRPTQQYARPGVPNNSLPSHKSIIYVWTTFSTLNHYLKPISNKTFFPIVFPKVKFSLLWLIFILCFFRSQKK